jgi:hypothetical protein
MAYIITIIDYPDGSPMPSGVTTRAVTALKSAELKRTLFNWREGDKLTGREERILDVIWGQAFNISDKTMVTVEKWGAARAVNWMVANHYDPVTEDFIETFNKEHS